MKTKFITVNINAKNNRIFEMATAEEKQKIEVLISLKLTQITRDKKSLEEVMSEISTKAQKRGLTPEILDSILDDNE